MPIEFRCTGCGKLLRVADASAGADARCPECDTIVRVPGQWQEPSTTAPTPPAGETAEDSPYSSPQADPGETVTARDRVSGAATGLMIAGTVGVVLNLASVVAFTIFGGLNFNFFDVGGWFFNPIAHFMSAVVGLFVCGIIIFGGMKMRELENYPLVLTAAILATVPCIGACCLLEVPFGIWALIVLSDKEVSQAFR
jgi:phage FluMu protein Com